jgi:DNA topoisomerase-1
MQRRCDEPGCTLPTMATRRPSSRSDDVHPSARQSARQAGLRYASSDRPGLARRRSGRGFTYLDLKGRRIVDQATIARIRALAIPPAWTDVWICPDSNGHLQATGRDARGRKQYRYHPDFRARRRDARFDRLLGFAGALPRIRRRVNKDLARRALTRDKVLAAVVRLLELSLIRVGNDEYARTNRSFGLTTFQDRHVQVRGSTIRFRFRGKSGRRHDIGLRDRRLAAIVRRCQALPGQELFQYLDESGEPHDVRSDDVNAYLRDASGSDVTASDFRTWAGTVHAYRALAALESTTDVRVARRNVLEAIRASAAELGNTETVARASYVHPGVLEAYLEGSARPRRRSTGHPSGLPAPAIDRGAEADVVELLSSLADSSA